MYEQIVANITSQTKVDVSNANITITNIQGEAQASSTRILNDAEAYSQNIIISSQSLAYANVSAITGQTASDTLMDYIYYTNLLNKKNATFLVGINQAMIGGGASGKGY